MNLINGISYNYKGLKYGIKTPGLLALGLIRFAVIVALTIVCASLALVYYQKVLNFIWVRPDSSWIVWLWHMVSWIVALMLVGVSAIVSFLVSQLLFSVVIMDTMSRITEKRIRGNEKSGGDIPWFAQFIYLLRQEIPRAVIPVLIAMILMVLGWFTPLSPVITVLSSLAAVIFLAWDNTDLVPARRMEPFGTRFKFLMKTILFHLGFGLWFLIPGLNILFLSFAPVGATLFYIEQVDRNAPGEGEAISE